MRPEAWVKETTLVSYSQSSYRCGVTAWQGAYSQAELVAIAELIGPCLVGARTDGQPDGGVSADQEDVEASHVWGLTEGDATTVRESDSLAVEKITEHACGVSYRVAGTIQGGFSLG